MAKNYKVDLQNGKVRYLNSLNHARAYAYHKFFGTKRELPILIYSPSGKKSGMVAKNWRGQIEWYTFTAKNGSKAQRLFENGQITLQKR